MLIEPSQRLLFMLAGWLLNLTPGPDVLCIINRALRGGRRAGHVVLAARMNRFHLVPVLQDSP